MFLQRVRKGARRAPRLTTVRWEAASVLTSRSAATLALVSHRISPGIPHILKMLVVVSWLDHPDVCYRVFSNRMISVKLPRFPMLFLSIVKKIQFSVSGLTAKLNEQSKTGGA